MFCLLEGIPESADLKSEISDLKAQAESISRQLRAWADSLQNPEINVQRHLKEKTRKSENAARDRREFLKKLEQIRTESVALKSDI